MRSKFLIAFTGLLCMLSVQEARCKEVTNDDLRGAILSLVHSYNVLDNKLERHEHRERALGEVIKRALQALQKGQKVYEPIKGIFSRLDERVSQIETMLIAQEEKYNGQSEKLTETIESMFKWMTANAACGNIPPPSGSPDQQKKLIEKIDKLSDNIDELTKSSKRLLDQTERMADSKLSSTDEVLSKMEDKLSHFYITGPASTAAPLTALDSEFENKMTNYLDKIYDRIGELKKFETKLSSSDKEFFQGLYNDTQKSVGNVKDQLMAMPDQISTKTSDRVKQITSELAENIEKISTSLVDSKTVADSFYADVNQSISTLQNELDIISKFDKVLLATSDYVLDTQRKVEYGTHQVLMKVGDLIKNQNGELNSTIQKRFEEINDAITNNHQEALQNLSSVMESEISHVWRQIEIMHGEITYSKDALEKLQDQTETYVNGTSTSMERMGGKVIQITGRMTEVDENLNYLLGRLSLVTHEFNQIKTGLGAALDQIRGSFQAVQDKIKDVGPGPHVIPGDAEA